LAVSKFDWRDTKGPRDTAKKINLFAPLVVFEYQDKRNKYSLVDGQYRLQHAKANGQKEVWCYKIINRK